MYYVVSITLANLNKPAKTVTEAEFICLIKWADGTLLLNLKAEYLYKSLTKPQSILDCTNK